MPAYKDVEVWIEDSECRKLSYQGVTISLVDDRTVTAKIEMGKDELYTVHCLSPTSVFCDVFVLTPYRARKRAARFHIDKSLAVSKNASGSSMDHTEGQFRDHGLKTPKRQLKRGKLGGVEVEIRRIGKIIKGEPQEECEVNRGEGNTVEFSMIDDFSQPAWLVFHFDICAKESPAALVSTVEHVSGHVPPRMVTNLRQTTSESRISFTLDHESSNKSSRKGGHGRLSNPRKHYLEHDTNGGRLDSADQNPIVASPEQLHEEYVKEEAEEQRLLQKLQEQLQTKRARNMELRRLLRETP